MSNKYDQEMEKLFNDFVKQKSSDEKGTQLPIVCPTNYGKPCRLCDLSKTILFKKDNEGTPLRARASELNRKQAYYSNVIFPSNPSEIVIFQYGYSIWKEMMLFQMGPGSEVTDWLDPKLGRNVVITKTTVGGNKRRTTYSTKTKINASPLMDMSVLKKLSLPDHQLDQIIELIMAGKAKPVYQSQLQEGPNEIRFLPSWHGPGVSKFFHQVLYHYGLTKEEFEMVQKGDYNPFVGIDVEDAPVEEMKPAPKPVPVLEKVKEAPKSLWGEYMDSGKTEEVKYSDGRVEQEAVLVKAPPMATESFPPCYGKQYDAEDDECTKECAADGWAESCKTLMEKTKLSKRQTAKRLVQ